MLPGCVQAGTFPGERRIRRKEIRRALPNRGVVGGSQSPGMTIQRTLRRSVSCSGIGLHSGRKVTLRLKPAPADHGIRFKRLDLDGLEVPAVADRIAGISYATGLAQDAASVGTVEHLLAALVGLGVDNVSVELNQAEVPIMDGSAASFVYLVHEAGVRTLKTPRRFLKVIRPIAPLPRQQADCRLRFRSLQGHVQHQLRSPVAPPPVADPARDRGDVCRGDRPGEDVRLPEGGRTVAEEGALRWGALSTTPSSSVRPVFSTTRCDSRTSSCATRSST